MPYNGGMADLLFLLIVLGFFGVATLFVRACDALVTHDRSDGRSEP
jgi:hypothetical protein